MTRPSDVLIGRGAELDELRKLLDDAQAGSGSAGCLEGAPGIGKTALLTTVADYARDQGFTVVTAQASTITGQFAFGVVRQLFEPPLAGTGAEQLSVLLSGAAASATVVLADEPPVDGHTTSSPVTASYANLRGLYWLAVNLAASGPVLIAIDDLQWVDLPSLRWLAYLARRLDGVAIAVLSTLNLGESPNDPTLVAELSSMGHRLRVDSLDRGSVTLLAERAFRRAPDAEFAAACWTATGGNPLLLGELLRALADEGVTPVADSISAIPQFGPPALARRVTAKLARHGHRVVAVARALAMLENADLPTLAAMAELEPPAVADALDVLTEMGLVTEDPRLGFAHGLVRDAVLHEMDDFERSHAHARAAELLHRAHAPHERVTAHLLNAHVIAESWVADVLCAAAKTALAKGASEIAVAYLRRALDEPLEAPLRYQALGELGLAELHVDLPAAIDHIATAMAHTEDVGAVARMAGGLARSLFEHERYLEELIVLERAAERIAPQAPELALLFEILACPVASLDPSTVSTVGSRLAEVRDRVLPNSHAETCLAAVAAHWYVRTVDQPDEAREQAHRALAGGVADHVDELLAIPLAAALALIALGEAQEAYELCDRLIDQARRRGMHLYYAESLPHRAWAAYQLGRLADARDDALAALDMWKEFGVGRLTTYGVLAMAVLVETLTELGEPRNAQKMLATYGLLGDLPESLMYAALVHTRGHVRAALDDPHGALADYLDCGRRAAVLGMSNPALHMWRSQAARAYAVLGEPDQAHRLADEELVLARRFGRPRPIGIALHTVGLLAGAAERIELLAEAEAVLADAGAPVERAGVLIDLGITLREAGRRSEARRYLRQAVALADGCGAAHLASKSREQLKAAGVSRVPPKIGGISTLTAHERRIASMATDGSTNREIAQAYFVTQRAIELHLTRVYRKLGITRRAQLAAALHGATPPSTTNHT